MLHGCCFWNYRRKVFTRNDYPKIELPAKEVELITRPYAYLKLLEHNKDDGILLITLADMIGIGKWVDAINIKY